MTIVEIGDDRTVTARDYWSIATRRPSLDKVGNVVLLGWDSDFTTFLNVKFARPLITGDNEDNPLEIGRKYVFALAWSNSKRLSPHMSSVQSFGVAIGEE